MKLERTEMVEILEQIARTGHATARIQAIRCLLALEQEAEGGQDASAFDRPDEIAARRSTPRNGTY